jgi:predicted dinucleotide-binding enzyme
MHRQGSQVAAQRIRAPRPCPQAGAAASGADAVVLATGLWRRRRRAAQASATLAGTVVIDITNPLTADYMGLTLGHSTSAAEEIAKAVPGAEVVKAFNTVFAQVLAKGADFGGGRKVEVFLASDSERGKQTARTLAESMGFATLDAGGLEERALPRAAGRSEHLPRLRRRPRHRIAPAWIRS